MRRNAVGITDPEASDDALQEAARLRSEALEAQAQERREQAERDAVDIDRIRTERRDRRTPGGAPLGGVA
ncbi:hypothetical protein DF19_25115 [Streptomyces olindensis]|nr:hypothetical protein DF19_25115 [Streptomyces olindensis]